MYAVDLSEEEAVDLTTLGTEIAPVRELIWENPGSPELRDQQPELLIECRNRRHANAISSLMDHGYIREVRRGDRLVFQVYRGYEPVRLLVIPGTRRAA
ncbi:MAG: hypothetical protein ACI9W4_001285 [Rhodothermales bacterium]|jgi:hypothetical protein